MITKQSKVQFSSLDADLIFLHAKTVNKQTKTPKSKQKKKGSNTGWSFVLPSTIRYSYGEKKKKKTSSR